MLIIAPRHVKRVNEIGPLLARLGLSVRLRTKAPSEQTRSPDCLLLDSTGELQDWYAIATIVFVGKSLTAHGGQNPVEPILAGKPVLFGPHMENFMALTRSLVANRAAIQVHDQDALKENVASLLRDQKAAMRLVSNAWAILDRHRGATARTARLLLEFGKAQADQRPTSNTEHRTPNE